MKKVHSYVLYGISFCLFSIIIIGCDSSSGIIQTSPTVVGRQLPYNLETDHISMVDLGKMFESMGKEIKQKGQVTIGGNTYPVTGFGSMECSIRRRVRRAERTEGEEGTEGAQRIQGTSINFEINAAGREGPPTRGTIYISYDRGGMRMTPAEFAGILAKMGNTLENKGVFALDDHSVTFEGKAKIVQLLTRTNQRMGPGSNYNYKFDIMFGQNDFPIPQDEAEDPNSLLPEERELRGLTELGKKEVTGADQKVVAKLIASLSRDLKAGRLRVGDQDLQVGENIRGGYSHLIALDGKSHRIRVNLQFREGPPPERRPAGPRYGEEFINKPIKDVGELMKRLGEEILAAETIKLGENEFRVGQKASYEVSANPRGFSIELRYTETPEEE